ncbi:MAG: hypothetical protein IJA86_05315, partial [Clostridia bacterium]|nr:hypothetical protein [Clostridia bacterium]
HTMLYRQKETPNLTPELFQTPTAEYRGTPFWAWNCKLEQGELNRQLEIFKKMGFGGAHMHVRTGMATKYLSDEFMTLIRNCVKKAKSENMLAWLYDEDRWPSGSAGGEVTKEKRFRARHMLFTYEPRNDLTIRRGEPDFAENGGLIACFDVELNKNGKLISWQTIAPEADAHHEKWYAYMEIHRESSWHNGQTYVDTLNKEAIDRFIAITHESYKRAVSDEFGKTIPSIFTDEPQFSTKTALKHGNDKGSAILPWTDDLPETFSKTYKGANLIENLPELIWERADGTISVTRYRFHDHVCERFAEAFADNCGKWCKENGIYLTGHVMREPSLRTQTNAIGEAMRLYRGFGIPGVDMLERNLEYTTVKQAQSAVHQFGREGVLCEMYGVSNWDFDFREHKMNGDWMAALGVTVRVPHLSLVSMAGEAKRDYPASIHYQSPWWKQYPLIEDHFARVNTALTRGKPVVRIGVIHPIESYWIHWGPHADTLPLREDMDNNFQNLTKWLLFGGLDFDFISESLMPTLCKEASAPLRMGEMAYDAIVVPSCETLRSTTLEKLKVFRKAGGKLIFMGEIPTLENAVPSTRGEKLAKNSTRIPFTRNAILSALESVREVDIRTEAGVLTTDLLHQLRLDGESRWLFVARGTIPYNRDISRFKNLVIRIKGNWRVSLYDTATGDVKNVNFRAQGGETEILCRAYDYDSFLFRLDPTEESLDETAVSAESKGKKLALSLPITVPYTISEPNALLLDQAEYALDDGEWEPSEEILRLDDLCREKLGWPTRRNDSAQQWAKKIEPHTHTLRLRFRIHSEIDYEGAMLAIEDAERLTVMWNGKSVKNIPIGWYADKAIKTIALPTIKKGKNILELSVPFAKHTNTEWAYLLGAFGVEVCGRSVHVTEARKELAFGDITEQGLPFYGGNLTYHIPIETAGGDVEFHSPQYKGILQTVSLDNGKENAAIYPPYTVRFQNVCAGKHTLNVTLYGHRRNGFGPVHLANLKETWIGPTAWRTTGEAWCYDYMICEEGIMTTPRVFEYISES